MRDICKIHARYMQDNSYEELKDSDYDKWFEEEYKDDNNYKAFNKSFKKIQKRNNIKIPTNIKKNKIKPNPSRVTKAKDSQNPKVKNIKKNKNPLKSNKVVNDELEASKQFDLNLLKTGQKFKIEDKELLYTWLSSNEIYDKDGEKDKELEVKPKNWNPSEQDENNLENNLIVNKSLDLHNYTVKEALDLLRHTILKSKYHNNTVLKIIHGKGKHSKNKKPILKEAVQAWLESEEGKNLIKKYKEAPKIYGGSGTTLVWLRQTNSAKD